MLGRGDELHDSVVHVVVPVETNGHSSAAYYGEYGQEALEQGDGSLVTWLAVAAAGNQVDQQHQQREYQERGRYATQYAEALQ